MLFVFLAVLAAGIANGEEMSAQWYREKELSWERARAQFPESAHDGAFKDRMLKIDAWAKDNYHELYYDSNKPFILAQKVQQEIDDLAEAERTLSEPLGEVANESTTRVNTGENPVVRNETHFAQRAATEPTTPVLEIQKPDVDPSSAPKRSVLGSAFSVAIVFALSLLFYRIVSPKGGVQTATAHGRKWAAFTGAFFTISTLPRIFPVFEINSVARWVLAMAVFTPVAFLIGWIVGKKKYGHSEPVSALLKKKGKHEVRKQASVAQQAVLHTVENPEMTRVRVADTQLEPPPLLTSCEFEVNVPEGDALKGGYVAMRHNTRYSLHLKNHRRVPCDARVIIDGNHVGTWRIDAQNEIRIERSGYDTGYFTFFEVGTNEAAKAGIAKSADNGLISVTFKPKKEDHALHAAELPDPQYGVGATGLTGKSNQRFRIASKIEHDMARAFTIHLRLVSRRSEIRPLAPHSAPIPPPVA